MSPEQFLQQLVDEGSLPGAAFAYGQPGSVVVGAVGRTGFGHGWPLVTPDTLYDVASLTKVFVTTEIARKLQIPLELAVKDVLPAFISPDVTVEHLLRHESGLPAYCECEGQVLEYVLTLPLESEPGSKAIYSCLGFIVLRHVLENWSGESFENLFQRFVALPNNWTTSGFCPKSTGDCAPTDLCEAPGTVHDPLARAQGGMSGNAGLFGTVAELSRLCSALIADPEVKQWSRRVANHDRGLGWDLKSPDESSCGSKWSSNSFGHTGFTGTSVWFEPETDFFALLLTNNICYLRIESLRIVRLTFADIALARE